MYMHEEAQKKRTILTPVDEVTGIIADHVRPMLPGSIVHLLPIHLQSGIWITSGATCQLPEAMFVEPEMARQ